MVSDIVDFATAVSQECDATREPDHFRMQM